MTTLYPATSINDSNSFANNHQMKVEHYDIHWHVSFERKKLIGHVVLHARVLVDNPLSFVLDARTLDITSVTCNDVVLRHYTPNDAHRQEEGYPADYGYPLIIHLDDLHPLKQNDLVQIRVDYNTNDNSKAIQWLAPEQTLGKKHPYLFTQAQAIHARSMLPCQDTPSSKATYDAYITVLKPLVAVMSASPAGNSENADYITYKFEQKLPIPCYLIALGVGALKSREIGPRSVLWSEEELLEEGAYEFANTEKFIEAAEDFLPKYQWGRYDLLLLPPSFPYGGMENPMLTFVTPTLLAGDRSLENVVAHEIAHSWSGNLVTNKNWASFWLNEGFTVFIERRIIARLYGEAEAELHALLGWYHLVESLEMYEEMKAPQLTKMMPELTKVDPDDAFSSLPYEKGFNFLYYLSKQIVGSVEAFEKFLYSYFDKFAKQSISADDMKNYFIEYFSNSVSADKLNSIEWDKWFYSEGYPVFKNEFDTSKADAAKQLAQKWLNNASDKTQVSISDWSSNQISLFLDTLLESTLSHQVVDELESTFQFSTRKNMEIRFRFLMIALKASHEKYYQAAVKLATEQGRMKFTRPLFRSLNKAKNGRDLAVKEFSAHRDEYHLICSSMVAKDLGL